MSELLMGDVLALRQKQADTLTVLDTHMTRLRLVLEALVERDTAVARALVTFTEQPTRATWTAVLDAGQAMSRKIEELLEAVGDYGADTVNVLDLQKETTALLARVLSHG